MSLTSHLLGNQPRLVKGTGGCTVQIFGQHREGVPEGEPLQCTDNLHTGSLPHHPQNFEVYAQRPFVQQETGRRNFFKINCHGYLIYMMDCTSSQ